MGIYNANPSLQNGTGQNGTYTSDNWNKGVYNDRKRDYGEYMFGEMSAENTLARQEYFFNTYQSPEAQMKMLKKAGLSPSIYASGGLPGGSGTSGIGGTGGGGNTGGSQAMIGILTAAKELSLMGAQVSKTKAERDLIKAQTNNLNENTTTIQIENEIKKLNTKTYKNQWELLNNTFFGNENGILSWSELTNNSKDYDQFQKKVYETLNLTNNPLIFYVKSEEGQKTLRQIYNNNKNFNNEIAVLANSEENAKLMLKITNLLNENNFANENANAQIKQLKQIAESAELTTEQKGAMNRLLDKMGDSTTSDIILVLLMTLSQYSHANLNLGFTQTKQIKK